MEYQSESMKPMLGAYVYRHGNVPLKMHIEICVSHKTPVTCVSIHNKSIRMECDDSGPFMLYSAFIDNDHEYKSITVYARVGHGYEKFTVYVDEGHRIHLQALCDFDATYKALRAFLQVPHKFSIRDEKIILEAHSYIHDKILSVYKKYPEEYHFYGDDLHTLYSKYRKLINGRTEFTPDILTKMYRITV